MSRLTLTHKLLAGVLGLGLAARLAQYVFNRSLWLDEAFLAMNVLQRDWAGLLRPLNDNQVAPWGFLYVEKLLVGLLGDSEYVLRLWPLIGSLGALLLFYRVARTSLGVPSALVGTALLGWSQPAIYFASELKPYATDMLLVVVAYALGLPALQRPGALSRRHAWLLGLSGALLVWFSYPVLFVLASIGTPLVLGALRGGRQRPLLRSLAPPLLWAASLGLLYAANLSQGFANEFLRTYWQTNFASFPPRSLQELYWYAQLFFDFWVQAGGMPFYGLATFAWLAGLAVLFGKGQWRIGLALGLPLVFAMGAAAMQRYPFVGRTLLFAVPPACLLAAHGAHSTYQALARQSRSIAAIFMCVLLFHPLYRTTIVFYQPLTTEELRPILQHVREGWQPGDRIYVYHGAARPFQYYAPRYGFDDEQLYTVSTASNGDLTLLAEDIQAMRGTRAWFVFAHIYTFNGISEDAYTLDLLDRAWPRLDAFTAPGAAAYLYDMRSGP